MLNQRTPLQTLNTAPNLRLPRQEDQNTAGIILHPAAISGAGPSGTASGTEHLNCDMCRMLFYAALLLHRPGIRGIPHRNLVERLFGMYNRHALCLEPGGFEGGGHHQQFQMRGKQGLRLPGQHQAQVGLLGAFMKLIQNHHGSIPGLGIRNQPPNKDALCHYDDAGILRKIACFAGDPSDRIFSMCQAAYSLGNRAHGSAPRLQHNNFAGAAGKAGAFGAGLAARMAFAACLALAARMAFTAGAPQQLCDIQRHYRGFSAAGRGLQHRHLIPAYRVLNPPTNCCNGIRREIQSAVPINTAFEK